MADKAPNLKIGIGADTKDWDKGAKQVKSDLKDLQKTGTEALGSIGDAFGVNTGKVAQMTASIRGLGQKMSEAGNAGVAAFGNILKSITPIGGAIAGIGIGAAIAGFKELQKEADAFKNTVAGANMEMATAAYVDTYKQILRDFNGDVGKSIAETESKWKKFWGTIGITMRELFTTGAWQGSYQNPAGGAAMDEYLKRVGAASQGAQKAQDITNQIYELERKRKEQAVELAKLNDDIADKMQVAKDATASAAEREDAIYKIELMLSQKRAMTVGMEEKLAELYKERSSLASDSVEEADAVLAQEVRVYETSRAITQEETSLLKIKNSIGKATDAEIARMNELLKKQKELQDAIDKTHAKWAGMSSALPGLSGGASLSGGAVGPAMTILPRQESVDLFRETFVAQLGEITVAVGFKADTEKIKDITNEVTSLLSSAVSRSAELIGNLVGTLAGGGDGWAEFKNAALSAFGDMAMAVGKIAISTGLAVSGIQAAINSGNWYLAVAAGAALVALGAAVKSSLSAVANGDYSASGGGYSSSGYSSSGGDFETRNVNVNVTGTLQADGNQLIAVIQNQTQKNYYME